MIRGPGVTGSPKLISSWSLSRARAMEAAIDRRRPWYSSSSRMGTVLSVVGSNTTPSSLSVAAMAAILWMISVFCAWERSTEDVDVPGHSTCAELSEQQALITCREPAGQKPLPGGYPRDFSGTFTSVPGRFQGLSAA